jgi:4-amino-4-deoxy-L-arabinose transferase-like glycosyltransferase
MRARGDYVVPYFNNQYRFDKPPLTYWFQVASYELFGENDFAARFPSAVAASLTALLLFAWGGRIGTHHVGLWAAIIFTLCLQTFMHAKAAVADMWLVLFMTAGHRAAWEMLVRGKRRAPNIEPSTSNEEPPRIGGWWLMFYVSIAFAFLAKGPIGWTPLAALGISAIVIRDRQRHSVFRTTATTAAGLILMLAIVGLWALPALNRTNGEFFRVGIGRHVVDRSLGAMEGHGGSSVGWYLLTLPFYFVTLFLSFFPWSFKLPWLFRHLRNRDALDNYLLVAIAVIFGAFTLIATKLPHYTLPAFPLLALLMGRHLSNHFHGERTLRRTAIATAIVFAAAALLAFPLVRQSFPSVALYESARAELSEAMEFGAVEFTEPSLVWYFRSRAKGWFSVLRPANVAAFMDKPGGRFVVLPDELARKLYPTLPATWKKFTAHGFNIAKGKRLDLALIVKPAVLGDGG